MRLRSLWSVLACVACNASGPMEGESPPDATIAVIDAALPADAPGVVVDGRGADDAPPVVVADSGTIPVVPDPGTGPLPRAWPDTEPNDTPEQAVRIGMGSVQIGPYIGLFEAPDGHIGGGDDADYFVFRTAPGTETSFIAGACWDAALNVNLLDFALYKVIDGQPLIPITSSSSTDTVCERQQPFSIPLDPDSKYLFAVTHVEGEGGYEA